MRNTSVITPIQKSVWFWEIMFCYGRFWLQESLTGDNHWMEDRKLKTTLVVHVEHLQVLKLSRLEEVRNHPDIGNQRHYHITVYIREGLTGHDWGLGSKDISIFHKQHRHLLLSWWALLDAGPVTVEISRIGS